MLQCILPKCQKIQAPNIFRGNKAIYFSEKLDFENLDTLVIHECIHALQEVKNSHGKLLKLGLFDVLSGKGQGINEASVQLMSSLVADTNSDRVKYYNMTFETSSPLFYPIETALINQMLYFTGSYPLFHSTLYSNHIFKNTFIAKSSEKIYNQIATNFDLLLHYETLLAEYSQQLSNCAEDSKKINRLTTKIDTVKTTLLNLTLSTQNMILENCFQHEFDFITDTYSLTAFEKKLHDFRQILITTDSYHFYDQFVLHMMNQLEEKRELIKVHGTLSYLNNLQTELLDLEQEHFGLKFFYRLFDKLKLLFEEAVRNKNHSDIN